MRLNVLKCQRSSMSMKHKTKCFIVTSSEWCKLDLEHLHLNISLPAWSSIKPFHQSQQNVDNTLISFQITFNKVTHIWKNSKYTESSSLGMQYDIHRTKQQLLTTSSDSISKCRHHMLLRSIAQQMEFYCITSAFAEYVTQYSIYNSFKYTKHFNKFIS